MARMGASRGKVKFGATSFCWLNDHILMIEYYLYAGTEFRRDLDFPLPPSMQWGDMGKKQNPKMEICVFVF